MICKNCGQYCPDGGRFCLHCGKPFDSAAPAVVTSDSAAEEHKRNSIKLSGTATDEPPKSTVILSGGIPISQSDRSFRVRREDVQKSTNRMTDGAPTPMPTPMPTPTPVTPPKTPKKRSVGIIVLLILLVISACGLIGALLYHFGVIGDNSADKPTTAQPELPEHDPSDSLSQQKTESEEDVTEPPTLKEGEVLQRIDPAPLMAYAEKMMRIENLDTCYLYDIDGDGLCEMILRYGNGEADMVFDFYTYRNGLLYIGQLSGGHSSMCVANGQLSRHYVQMGYEDLYAVTLKNGAVCEELMRSSELAEGEDYASYPEPTNTGEKDLGIFLSVYTDDLNRVVTLSDYYVEKDGVFTNGQYAYQLLPDGTLWSIDAVEGITTVYASKLSEYITLFAVTEQSLFFENTDPDRNDWSWWGAEVFALDKNTYARTDYGDGLNGRYESGYVFLSGFRSDVSPTRLTVINSNDLTLIDDVAIWTFTVLDGSVFYYAIDAEAYNAWEPYSMTEYRLDSTGTTQIADFSLEKGGFVYFPDADTVCISSCTDSEYTIFDIRTGEPIS